MYLGALNMVLRDPAEEVGVLGETCNDKIGEQKDNHKY